MSHYRPTGLSLLLIFQPSPTHPLRCIACSLEGLLHIQTHSVSRYPGIQVPAVYEPAAGFVIPYFTGPTILYDKACISVKHFLIFFMFMANMVNIL